jgi:hypothetical protein
MAAFCTKCGSPLASSAGFCPACGTPIASAAPVAPVVAAAPVQTAAVFTPPPAQYGAPPVQTAPAYGQVPGGYPVAPQKSSSALKIILIVIAAIVVIGILGAGAFGFMAWRMAKSVHVDANGDNVSVSVPGGGTVIAGDSTATNADLGVPTYPGATREKGGMNLNSGSASMVMAHFSTNDTQDQVVDFYKGKMGDGTAVVSTGNGTVINSGGKDTDRIMVTVGPGSGDDSGKTTIVIMHTVKK